MIHRRGFVHDQRRRAFITARRQLDGDGADVNPALPRNRPYNDLAPPWLARFVLPHMLFFLERRAVGYLEPIVGDGRQSHPWAGSAEAAL